MWQAVADTELTLSASPASGPWRIGVTVRHVNIPWYNNVEGNITDDGPVAIEK